MTVALTPALIRVRSEIECCTRCPRLVEWRARTAGAGGHGRPVAGYGDPDARIFLLGLATSPVGGNRTGRAFTGNPSATFLVAGLHRAGLADRPASEHRDDGLRLRGAWMASAVRCPPPDHRPTAEERDACLDHLRAEWRALPRLRVVVALGAFAWGAAQRADGARPQAPFAHSRCRTLGAGVSLVGCYHPSPQNTRTGRLTAAMLDEVLRRARDAADHEPEEQLRIDAPDVAFPRS